MFLVLNNSIKFLFHYFITGKHSVKLTFAVMKCTVLWQ